MTTLVIQLKSTSLESLSYAKYKQFYYKDSEAMPRKQDIGHIFKAKMVGMSSYKRKTTPPSEFKKEEKNLQTDYRCNW